MLTKGFAPPSGSPRLSTHRNSAIFRRAAREAANRLPPEAWAIPRLPAPGLWLICLDHKQVRPFLLRVLPWKGAYTHLTPFLLPNWKSKATISKTESRSLPGLSLVENACVVR